MTDQQTDAWASYLVPGDTPVLVNVAGLTNPAAVAIFDRVVSAGAAQALLAQPDYDATFDLAHLSAIHQRLFADVYPFAGQVRLVDLKKPDQPDDGFIHHAWISPYLDSVTDQLRAEGNLVALTDPGQWSDRAAYYLTALDRAHTFRDGNARASRIWIGDLAHAAGHQIDWAAVTPAALVYTARAAQAADLEPARALLTQLTGGTLGVDRPVKALNDLDDTLTREAWSRTGLTMATESQQALIESQLPAIEECLTAIHNHLATVTTRAATKDQPAADRWNGFAVTLDPSITADDEWPMLATAFDRAVDAGYPLAVEAAQLVADPLDPERPARTVHLRLLERCDAAVTPPPAAAAKTPASTVTVQSTSHVPTPVSTTVPGPSASR